MPADSTRLIVQRATLTGLEVIVDVDIKMWEVKNGDVTVKGLAGENVRLNYQVQECKPYTNKSYSSFEPPRISSKPSSKVQKSV